MTHCHSERNCFHNQMVTVGKGVTNVSRNSQIPYFLRLVEPRARSVHTCLSRQPRVRVPGKHVNMHVGRTCHGERQHRNPYVSSDCYKDDDEDGDERVTVMYKMVMKG